jgi:hypothetical protein
MDEAKKQYLILIAEYEEKVVGYVDKITFKQALLDIISNHYAALTDDELRNAQKLLDYIQKEIVNY